jgi:selenide,water dikinase
MLPGLIAGHYDYAACHIDLEALCRASGVRFMRDVVTGIDPIGRTLTCASDARCVFDLVSLDIGSALTRDLLCHDDRQGVPVKPSEHFLDAWAQLITRARRQRLRILMIGSGAAGVEVTLAMQHRLRTEQARRADFVIVSASERILPGHSDGVRRRFERVLRERDVEVHLNSSVGEVDGNIVRLASGGRLAADWIVWAHGPRASDWVRAGGLCTDERGFVLVDQQLRSISHPLVFAAGDIASIRGHPRPKSGVYAVRQGPPLAANLRSALAGGALRRYWPQRQALALISTGDRHAVASRGRLSLEGAWVWRWKDRIDRKFMRRYRSF